MAKWRIERLTKSHERDSFDCGESMLNDFIRSYASQYDRKDMGGTYVAVNPPNLEVKGYYALSTHSVAFHLLPADVSKKLPRHPIPVALLGRLAVDQSA